MLPVHELVPITLNYRMNFPNDIVTPSIDTRSERLVDGVYEIDVEYQFFGKPNIHETYLYLQDENGRTKWQLKEKTKT